MPTVFEVLSRDHEEVKQMLSEFEKGPTAANGASPDQLALRKQMAETLVIEESKHEAVEEMYFWRAVRDRLPDGGRLADEATGQEQQAKQVLDRLDRTGADDPSSRSCWASSSRPGASTSRSRRPGYGPAYGRH
jgi:Hemerythrin HHE cation binding domain